MQRWLEIEGKGGGGEWVDQMTLGAFFILSSIETVVPDTAFNLSLRQSQQRKNLATKAQQTVMQYTTTMINTRDESAEKRFAPKQRHDKNDKMQEPTMDNGEES